MPVLLEAVCLGHGAGVAREGVRGYIDGTILLFFLFLLFFVLFFLFLLLFFLFLFCQPRCCLCNRQRAQCARKANRQSKEGRGPAARL